MTLDLVRVAEQMPALLAHLAEERATLRKRLRAALRLLGERAATPDAWRARLEAAQTRWPLALPLDEPVDRGYPPPGPPPAYTVVAVDGSHIDVDRNAAVPCFVLNLGWAVLTYGRPLPSVLDSYAELQPSTEALTIWDSADASQEDVIRGEVLSLLRGVREIARLAELAVALPADLPQVALLDGNLGLWNVTQAPISRRLRERLIRGEGGLLPALNALRALAEGRPLAVGAYTSAAGTADVVHSLRVADCPLEAVACTRCPGLAQPPRPCDRVGLATDAELFAALLAPGERSALFQARSRSFLRAEGPATLWYESEGHSVAFFYLRLEQEIARVELPLWLARRPERVALLHAVLLDQAAKGPGYPVALQEAHERAVITTMDRRAFAALLAREVQGLVGHSIGSGKARSKRVRAI